MKASLCALAFALVLPANAVKAQDAGARARSVETLTIRPSASADPQTPAAPVDGALSGAPEGQQPASTGPEPIFDLTLLPERVSAMRTAIMRAAASGDVERLRPVLESNEVLPTLTTNPIDDPISFLKSQSGDAEGREILAILIEVMDAGFVHLDPGGPNEMYVWPWLAEWPLEALNGPQTVQLLTLVTAGDLAAMRDYGAYVFWRVGIGPDGTWHYFVSGD